MKCYWWSEHPNWGDALSPLLLKHFAGIDAEWSEPADAEIVSTGSVLDVIPDGWSGIVAGSGQLHRDTITDLRQAKVLGVRGPLTARNGVLTDTNCVIGDPALLVPEMVIAEPNCYDLGIVPHWDDDELVERFKYLSGHYDVIAIDPTANPLLVSAAIGSCRKIVSSSLHGIIVADAFGIPRRAEKPPGIGSVCVCGVVHHGDEFKFEDHNVAVGLPTLWGVVQTADHDRIERIQYDLFNMFQELTHVLA